MSHSITSGQANRIVLTETHQLDSTSHALELKTVPAWIAPTAQELLPVLTAYELPVLEVMVRESLHGTRLYASADPVQHLNWVLMPQRYDALLHGEGLQMPRHIQQVYARAMESVRTGALDDVYIAHAWGGQETPLIQSGYVQPEDVPWHEMESPTTRRLESFWDSLSDFVEGRLAGGAARIVLAVGRAIGVTVQLTGRAALTVLAGTAMLIGALGALIIAAVVALAAVAAAALAITTAVASFGLVLVVALVAAPVAGIDPVIYGVKRVKDGYGRTYDVLYKLAEYDIR